MYWICTGFVLDLERQLISCVVVNEVSVSEVAGMLHRTCHININIVVHTNTVNQLDLMLY